MSTRSTELFARAQARIPGGVNSPVRACRAVGTSPTYLAKGAGAYVTDVDGHRYIDYIGSWGPLILGHAHKAVVAAITEAAQEGTSFGACVEREVLLAEQICRMVPHLDQVRFVSSGTEATMSAVRLARGFTGRDKLVKFAGCYHGHADMFLSEAGSGLMTLGIPASAGVPQGTARDTITLPYNDAVLVEQTMQALGHEVAAIIVEPVACNMGLVLPRPGFLETLRRVCDESGALLIFDEVITGFRLAPGGAQEAFAIRADLCTFGKIIGGGLPVGAYGGRANIMAHVAPLGSVYQAGTLSGNPLAMAAGLATLGALSQPGLYEGLKDKTESLVVELRSVFERAGVPAQVPHVASVFFIWFGAGAAPSDWREMKRGNAERYADFYRHSFQEHVLLAPSAFEVGFVSTAHGDEELRRTVDAATRWRPSTD